MKTAMVDISVRLGRTTIRRSAIPPTPVADPVTAGPPETEPSASRMTDVIAWLVAATSASAVAFAVNQSVAAGAIALPASAALVVATFTDVRRHQIPGRWIDAASVTTVLALAVRGMADRTFDHLAAGLVAAAITWVVWWTIRVTTRNGLGYGDVRLATMAALPLGGLWWPTAFVLTPSVLLVAAILLRPLRATVRSGRVPLAPAMALAWAGVLCLAAVAAVPVGPAK